MSRINRIRITNLNYNGNSIKVDDETFDLNGESTLLSLRNGGGKTVFVQMIMALFMNKGKRDLGERSFKSYFTTSRPTFIMTEWKLDNGQGFFIAGMMVRKNQSIDENDEEALEIINFTGYYKGACEYDIDNIPIVENEDGGRVLKGFGTCKKEFERLKKKSGSDFRYYDMNQPYQQRAYFAKLKEYQINHKEWETIIKKVNLKESGLSELFSDAKDEKGLVEKWFLVAIENKLNQEKSRIEGFRSLAYKLVKQYRDNQSNIKKKEIIEEYFKDAEAIEEKVKQYGLSEHELEALQGRIKAFIQAVDAMTIELSELALRKEEGLSELSRRIDSIEHERFSYDIYCMEEKRQEKNIERIQSEKDILRLEYKKNEAEKRLCLFKCALIYKEAAGFKERADEYKAKAEALKENQKEKEGEADRLGGLLYGYYEGAVKRCSELISDNENETDKCKRDMELTGNRRREEEENERAILLKAGELKGKTELFDRSEDGFNDKYKAGIARNILGEYEEGSIEVNRRRFQTELNNISEELKKLQEERVKLKSEELRLRDEEVTLNKREAECDSALIGLRQEKSLFEAEKARRLIIMQYIELNEESIDNVPLLSECLKGKIRELELTEDGYKREKETLSREYENLRQGKTFELPENVSAYMEENNIRAVYGMEWLKKNGRSVSANKKLVKLNPLLPYSIILGQSELERLKKAESRIYTNFPIPIILREKLGEEEACGGKGTENHGNIAGFGDVSFFVLFNEHLLNPSELKEMLDSYKRSIEELEARIRTKSEETDSYRGYKAELEGQSFTSVRLKETAEKIERAEAEKESVEAGILQCRKAERENQSLQKENEKKRAEAEGNKRYAEARNADYEALISDYRDYLQNIEKREHLKRRQEEIRKCISELKGAELELSERISGLRAAKESTEREREEYKGELRGLYQYEDKKEKPEKSFDLPSVRGRFEALTSKLAASIGELMEVVKTEMERYDKKLKELKSKNKYAFTNEDYEGLQNPEEEEGRAEADIKEAEREKNAAHERNNSLTGDIRELEANIANERKQLKERLDTDELFPKESIVDTNFKARLKVARFEYNAGKEELGQLRERLEGFKSTQDAMADCEEFQSFPDTEPIDVGGFTREELKNYQGNLRSQLNSKKNDRERARAAAANCIRRTAEKEVYREEFIKRGFDNLQDLTDNVYSLEKQLNILRDSYKGMLEKLQVDLENIDKERKSVEATFMDYIKDVDENMGRIDGNSTISVRGKNIKMLKISVPSWDENKEYYRKKLNDYVEGFISTGLEVIAANKNIDEFLGKVITTKNLYNEVVGIGNIGIRLYKIEAEREVPITWQAASVNSGGEGFLSAFVILTCLLSYMRKDETDLFSMGEEGKVLIMDNPFAQTNAEHLLKPLIDMAKKTNTQLICLSGIGGDSVYNRFDNIYVLNIESSNIRRGQEYLTGKHIKGENIEKLVLSQFKTEQINLFDLSEYD